MYTIISKIFFLLISLQRFTKGDTVRHARVENQSVRSIKKTRQKAGSFNLLQARLELAPRLSPDWILSPTRLPIPPLEHAVIFLNSALVLAGLKTGNKTDNNINIFRSQLKKNIR